MKERKNISIAITPEILKMIEYGNYNRSKLIDSLLSEYFKKEMENNSEKK
jgi:hypothetical protein